MEIIIKDLNNESQDVWHHGVVIKCNDTISFPPGTHVEFDARKSQLMEPNNSQKNLKIILSQNVRK